MNRQLRDLAEIYYGKSPAGYRVEHSEIPIYATSGQVGFASEPLFGGPLIVVARKGTLDNPTFSRGPCWVIDTAYAVVPRSDVDAKWLFYALSNHNLSALNEATGVPSINRDYLYRVELDKPDLYEQRKIAHILTTVDDLIDRTEALIAKLRPIKQGLMHDLLTRGVDAHGQLRPPREEAPELYKESVVGWVPREWEVCLIEDKLHRIIDYRGKTPHKTTEGIQLITARNVREGFFDPEPKEFIAEETYDSWMTRGIPQPGDVLFTTEAPLGNVARVPDYRVALGQRLLTLGVDVEVLDSSYLFWLLLSPVSQQQIVQRSTGSTVLGIKQSRFRRIPLPFPALHEQRIIGKILDSHNDRAREEESLYNKLEQVKTGLMQDLLTGKVRVNVD